MVMSTVERVHRAVLDGMLRGELAPGSWLRQDELASRLGVSKIPVREALQRLATARLVTFEPGRGAQVRALTAGDAEEIYALRVATEPRLLGRAVGRLTAVDLAHAEMALAGRRVDGGALLPTEANWAFHRALYRAAGWARALDLVETLHAAVAPYVLDYTQRLGGAATSDAEHHRLLELCRQEQAEPACALLAAHLDHAAAALVGALPS